ncbi:MAG: Fe-S oxidoreductase [Flavobacteriales bacterium]|nr:MAG: Fe-S oxidoreductase [Flavobacteriales bacterium]
MKVDIFIPCFMDQIYPETGMNMVKILEKCGCEVSYNPEQTCCGQAAFTSGYYDEAKAVGAKFIKEFVECEYIVTPSASCAGMVKNYYRDLFHNSAFHNDFKEVRGHMYELSDFLVNTLKVEDLGAELNGVGTYHSSCASLREYEVNDAPYKLLAKVKGLELKELKEADVCCGFGGQFAAKFEPIATSMVEQKVLHADNTGAEYIISTDSSCLMHIESYVKQNDSNLKVMHLADVLASGW